MVQDDQDGAMKLPAGASLAPASSGEVPPKPVTPGFFGTLANDGSGIPRMLGNVARLTGIGQTPESFSTAFHELADPNLNLIKQGAHETVNGGFLGGPVHIAEGLLPGGPMIHQAAGDIQAGNYGAGLARIGEVAAPFALAKGVDAIPRMSRASTNFDTVMSGARNEPINTAPARTITDRALTLASRGGTAPKVVGDFDRATTPAAPGSAPPPITYEAGRDFASNAGKLSTTESQAMKGDMGRQVKLLSQALNDANRDAAARVGLGSQYDAAMKEYRQANQIQSGVKTAAKIAVPMLGLGMAGQLARKYLVGEP